MAGELAAAEAAATKASWAAFERNVKIRAAVSAGYSLRSVAEVCGLSYQRVHQIVRGEPALTR